MHVAVALGTETNTHYKGHLAVEATLAQSHPWYD